MFWKKPTTEQRFKILAHELSKTQSDLDAMIERIKKLEKIMSDEKKRVITIYDSDVTKALSRLDALEKQLSDVSSGQLDELRVAFSISESTYKQYGDNLLDSFIVLRDAVKKVITASS